MALLLDVPYVQKDEAKALGAKWNKDLKKWYVEDYRHYPDFQKWILQDDEREFIICKAIYVVEAFRPCYSCKKNTPVIGFGVKNYLEMDGEMSIFYDFDESLRLFSYFDPMPDELLKWVKENYNFDKKYSNVVQDSYYGNSCKYCNKLQGQYYLFDELESPFFTDDVDELTIYEYPLEYDIVVEEYETEAMSLISYNKGRVKRIV